MDKDLVYKLAELHALDRNGRKFILYVLDRSNYSCNFCMCFLEAIFSYPDMVSFLFVVL